MENPKQNSDRQTQLVRFELSPLTIMTTLTSMKLGDEKPPAEKPVPDKKTN